MQNWYCLVHFPDGTEDVRLVPGHAPVANPGEADPIVRIVGETGLWTVEDITARTATDMYRAEIWVRPATEEELAGRAGSVHEVITA